MKRAVLLGFFLTLLLLIIHVITLGDYGFTWDFHHHFFAGLHHLGIPLSAKYTDHIPFTMPDPRTTYDLPFGPIMLVTPVLTYLTFFEHVKLLPMDQAYHLGIVLVAVLGILSFYLFLLEAEGFWTALFGFLFLAFLPRYFGDLHNNMKDVPQSAAFAFAIWMFWRLVNYRRPKDLLFAILGFAIAFNMKINALFIPVIAGAWAATIILFRMGNSLKNPLTHMHKMDLFLVGSYFFLAPLGGFLLWYPFWTHPVERLVYLFRFFQDNTENLEVLYFGITYRSTKNVPWYYPYGYIAITTPLLTLLSALAGCAILLKRFFSKHPTSLLYILWFFVPLARYLDPKIGVIDGIRHFEEVVYPVCAVAAIGFSSLFKVWIKRVPNAYMRFLPLCLVCLYLMGTIFMYHPFQIAYFNEAIGGINGALGKFDIDYWGTSQKQAVLWLNEHARKGSVVHIIMAPEAASLYLRPDLLANVNTQEYGNADYVVLLNRQSFYTRYTSVPGYVQTRTPVYEVTLMGVPLTMVFDNSKPPAPFPNAWWLHPVFGQ